MGKRIGLACSLTTGKLDANQAVEGGRYPFFTCSDQPESIDHFAFDDDVVLIAGNNAKGNFHVSRYKGKFNAYQRTYILRANAGFDIDYVYYALKLELKRLQERAQGSQTKFLTMPILTGITIPDIEHRKQAEIAAVLCALDAKINQNERINAEFEGLARSVFDYWFGQFDFPDLQGRPYRANGGKMVWNEAMKQEIPVGWDVVRLEELVSLVKEGVIPDSSNTGTPYIGLEHIPRKSIVLSSWSTADKAISNKTAFQRGDILFGKIRPYFHKVGLATIDGITSTDTIVMRPKSKEIAGLVLETIFSDKFVKAATQGSTGSKMPRADWNVMKNFLIAKPPKGTAILDRFQSFFDPLPEKIGLNVRQNHRLSALRDWLLPLLMNGQVQVESLVGQVTFAGTERPAANAGLIRIGIDLDEASRELGDLIQAHI